MERSGSDDFHIVKGWFSDTVPAFATTQPQIAILRLDGDWYDSTMTALELLFPLVVDRGLVLVDDYGTWDGCTRAAGSADDGGRSARARGAVGAEPPSGDTARGAAPSSWSRLSQVA